MTTGQELCLYMIMEGCLNDVLIIGAGPSGCIAAKTLSGKGYKVLLVEKNADTEAFLKNTSGMLRRIMFIPHLTTIEEKA